jgi:hypothetical protein
MNPDPNDDYEYGDGVCLECGLIWAEERLKGTTQKSGGCFRCGSFNWEFRPVDGTFEELYAPPCTCKPNCKHPCKGGCGCKCCHTAYGDFLSGE